MVVDPGSDKILYTITGGKSGSSSPGAPGGLGGRPAGGAPEAPGPGAASAGSQPTGPTLADLTSLACATYLVLERIPAASRTSAEQTMLSVLSGFCSNPASGQPATPPAAATVPPSAVAAAYWLVQGEKDLPRPSPSIPPGYALTGNPAYLVSHAPMTATFTVGSPGGTLTIDASAVLYVDWGDGTGVTGPYATPGAPWPDGTISHTYDTVGTYDVVVTEQWQATWAFAGTGGTLPPLTTLGEIPDFPVREVVSVRNR